MKFNILYELLNFSSVKKMICVYLQLKKAGIPNRQIKFNYAWIADIYFDCNTFDENIFVWGKKKKISLNYKKIFDCFFIKSGYKEKYILNPKLDI